MPIVRVRCSRREDLTDISILVKRDERDLSSEVIRSADDMTGDGDLFMLQVRGDSMIDAGILDGDYVVVKSGTEAKKGEIVVAGIPGEEATVKTYGQQGDKVVLTPHNPRLEPMVFDPDEVQVFGRVVTVMRRL